MNEKRKNPEKIEDGKEQIPARHLQRKRLLHYAIGVAGSISEGMIAKTCAAWPSWSLGLSEELKIGKYFGLTTGVSYSETHFKIDSPQHPDYPVAYPASYSSHLQEVSIPIGIKVYPYAKGNLSLSIGAAYVNHIKLRETFDYVMAQPIQASSIVPPNIFVTDIPFDIKSVTTGNTANYDPNATTAEYFSLANSNRYYGSLQFTAGLDYRFKKHFIFSAEPAFNMSLSKVVKQDARLYNIGMNLGLKYDF